MNEYIYPSATHTRFAHSLGTCYLAMQLLRTFEQQGIINSKNAPAVDKRTKDLVAAAALCHDLGHGPFSHTWDDFIDSSTHHEERSVMLFEQLVKDNSIPLTNAEICFVQSLIEPDSKRKGIQEEFNRRKSMNQSFLYDIVANYNCSVDVDKMDYISRDVMQTDVGLGGINYQRLFDDMLI
eukprot:UN30809